MFDGPQIGCSSWYQSQGSSHISGASLMAQLAKNPPEMQEIPVLVSIPGSGRSGEGNGYPLQYPSLENSTDCIVHRVIESDTTERLSLSPISQHDFPRPQYVDISFISTNPAPWQRCLAERRGFTTSHTYTLTHTHTHTHTHKHMLPQWSAQEAACSCPGLTGSTPLRAWCWAVLQGEDERPPPDGGWPQQCFQQRSSAEPF